MKWATKIFTCVMIVATAATSAQAITFDVGLDADQEIPAPAVDGSTPSGTATVDVNTITGAVQVNGSYAGTTSDVQAAHLHGLATADATAGVIFGFDTTGGTDGTLQGSDTLSPENLAGLLRGETYLNVHTVNNGPGEIRGQVVDADIKVFEVALDTIQEIPSPTLNGSTPTGSATVVVDVSNGAIEISGSYTGMTSDVQAAHLHGLGGPGDTAGVIFGFDVSGGTEGTFSGADTLSAENLTGLLAGQTYLNVHTVNNGPGEIRAQVPEPTTGLLALLGLAGLITMRRK